MIYLLNPAIEMPNVRFGCQPEPSAPFAIAEKSGLKNPGQHTAAGLEQSIPIRTADAGESR